MPVQDRKFVVLGAPGAGKRELSQRIASLFDVELVDATELVAQEVGRGGESALQLGWYLEQAKPALDAAEKALDAIRPEDIKALKA